MRFLDSPRTARAAALAAALIAAGCTARAPRNMDNSCLLFEEKLSWFRAAEKAEKEWRVPIPVQLAFVHQESRFEAKAKPPRRKILWVIPGPRRSSSYGYAQALDSTWSEYKRDAGRFGADRDDFADSVDFIGWYVSRSARRNRLPRDDAYNLYLAYHEGDGGFQRGTHRRKPTILAAAAKVRDRSSRYALQLAGCRDRLRKKSKRWFW